MKIKKKVQMMKMESYVSTKSNKEVNILCVLDKENAEVLKFYVASKESAEMLKSMPLMSEVEVVLDLGVGFNGKGISVKVS